MTTDGTEPSTEKTIPPDRLVTTRALERLQKDAGTLTDEDIAGLQVLDTALGSRAAFARFRARYRAAHQSQRPWMFEDWQKVRAVKHPAEWSDEEIDIIADFDEDRALEAFEARQRALEPPPPPAAAAARIHRPQSAWPHKDESWDDYVRRAGDQVVSIQMLDTVLCAFIDIFKDVNEKNAERNERIAALEKTCAKLESQRALDHERVKALEARPELAYRGVWKSTEVYTESRLVTHDGGLWLSERATGHRPGTTDSGWRLIVKQGRA